MFGGVFEVAGYGMLLARKMNSYLVFASRFDAGTEVSVLGVGADAMDVGDCFLVVDRAAHTFFLPGGMAQDYCLIGLFDTALSELGNELFRDLRVICKDQAARGFFV